MRCLVIDDEAPARSRLSRMLQAHPDVEIAGEAEDGLEAVRCIDALRPDVIFLDIQMPGLDGFGVLRSLPPGIAPFVVFVTGFDHHALDAFDANALAYLLKPVEADRLTIVLERAALLCGGRQDVPAPQDFTPQITQVVGRKRDRLVLLAPGDIVFFCAESGLIHAHTASERYLVNHQLTELEASLGPDFFRARREVLVSLASVKEIRPYFKSSFLLVMNDGNSTEIAVSERQAKRLRQRIPGL